MDDTPSDIVEDQPDAGAVEAIPAPAIFSDDDTAALIAAGTYARENNGVTDMYDSAGRRFLVAPSTADSRAVILVQRLTGEAMTTRSISTATYSDALLLEALKSLVI